MENDLSQLKKKLGVTDMNAITEAQVAKFIQMIPEIDKDVALEFIKGMPASLQATAGITEQLRLLASDGISSSNESTKDAMKGYQSILDSMAEAEKDKDLSFEEKEKIWEKMESVAEKMDKKDSENKAFVLDTLKTVGKTLLGGALVVTAVVFGAKYLGSRNNDDDYDDDD